MYNKTLNIISIAALIISVIINILNFITIIKLDILPINYLLFLITFITIFFAMLVFITTLKKTWLKIVSLVLIIISIVLNIFILLSTNNILDFINHAFNNNSVEVSTYKVYVLSSNSINSPSELVNKKNGYLINDNNLEEILKKTKEINIELNRPYEDIYEIYDELKKKTIDSIIIDDALVEILEENNHDIYNYIKKVYSFDVENNVLENSDKLVNLKPINILISGSDSRSTKIYNKSRSDVNMILTINPNTKEVLMTSIPRDYYVQVYNQTGLKDKLTHTGIYGITTTEKTIENLLSITIDYSIKIGFPSVVKLVDLVGGIDIESDKSFYSYQIKDLYIKKGTNHFNGAEALAYSRERHAYASGDRHRILNQQQVLEATLTKILTNKSSLLKYDELLSALSNLYITTIPKEWITLMVKNQLVEPGTWSFISQSISGSDASLPTHTAPNTKRYVMIPYEDDIRRATTKINEILTKTE